MNFSCKKQGEFIMNKDYKKHEIVNFIIGFAVGYFLTDFILSLFIPRKNKTKEKK